MRVADFIVKRLGFLGLDTSFLVTGGGAMHLNDAIGASDDFRKVYCHHEQGASIAAEAYARVAVKPALLNVTTGPGGINALNGVFGAYTDSIPMIVVSGQVKRETMLSFNVIENLRQLGDQEVDIVSMVNPITKWAYLLRDATEIAKIIDAAFLAATTGRPGPAWLDVPVDLQGTQLPDEFDLLINSPINTNATTSVNHTEELEVIYQSLLVAKRPVIIAGTGIRIADVEDKLLELAEQLEIPVVTAWTHDIFPNEHPLFAGRPGTIGTRAGNFVVQSADLVIILGSRLNIRQVSYNWTSFARNAKKIWVDIDPAEFKKPFVKADVEVVADLKHFLPQTIQFIKEKKWTSKHRIWVEWCQDCYKKYSPAVEDYPVSDTAINAYHFIAELFNHLNENDIVVCGDATATIVPYQIGFLKKGMRLISNSGSASMGYDIPAALGAAIANPQARVICLAGDGSSMMNIQELQTISGLGLNVIVFILNNDGYLSIKQTQRNFFAREAGSSSSSGLTFPDFTKVGAAFGLTSTSVEKQNWQETLRVVMQFKEPTLCDVGLDTVQEFEPRLKSKMENGVITTPELDDMFPFYPSETIAAIRASAQSIK